MTQVHFYLDDLTEEAQQRYIEAVEEASGEPFYENEDRYEFNVWATIDDDGVEFE